MKIGDSFSFQFEITGETINNYADLSGDYSKVHMNNEFAIELGFKSRIAHGNILGMYLSRLVGEELPQKNVVIQKQEMTFYNPIYVDDTLELTVNIADFHSSVNTYELKCRFENQNGLKICIAKIMIGKL